MSAVLLAFLPGLVVALLLGNILTLLLGVIMTRLPRHLDHYHNYHNYHNHHHHHHHHLDALGPGEVSALLARDVLTLLSGNRDTGLLGHSLTNLT